MKRIISVFLAISAMINVSLAEETAFRGVKLADAKGKQADASLVFSDNNKNVVVRVADRDFVIVPYDQLDKFSYEYTKKHRITQGAIAFPLTSLVQPGPRATGSTPEEMWSDNIQRPMAIPTDISWQTSSSDVCKCYGAPRSGTRTWELAQPLTLAVISWVREQNCGPEKRWLLKSKQGDPNESIFVDRYSTVRNLRSTDSAFGSIRSI